MHASDSRPSSDFVAGFPRRFAEATANAQGTIAGIAASGGARNGALDAESLRLLHEIYRLRVELELETAAVLWRAGEVATAMADALRLLSRRPSALHAVPGLGEVDARGLGSRPWLKQAA